MYIYPFPHRCCNYRNLKFHHHQIPPKRPNPERSENASRCPTSLRQPPWWRINKWKPWMAERKPASLPRAPWMVSCWFGLVVWIPGSPPIESQTKKKQANNQHINWWWQLKYFFLCSSRTWGKMNPIWRAYFFRWVETTNEWMFWSRRFFFLPRLHQVFCFYRCWCHHSKGWVLLPYNEFFFLLATLLKREMIVNCWLLARKFHAWGNFDFSLTHWSFEGLMILYCSTHPQNQRIVTEIWRDNGVAASMLWPLLP